MRELEQAHVNHPPPFAQAADAAVLRRLLAEGWGGRAAGVCGTADLALLRLLLEASITFSCSSLDLTGTQLTIGYLVLPSAQK